jgi:phosphatidate cytidylyltransferase
MLRQRVITAVVLLALLLPALVVRIPLPFGALTLALIGAAGWEWCRLNGAARWSIVFGAGLILICIAAWAEGAVRAAPSPWWMGVAGLLVAGGAWVLSAGVGRWARIAQPLRLGAGLLLLALAWLALATARAVGLNFILSVFCLVWVGDVAAYFGGKAFGQNKLAPDISPGKTWEGVWSGMLAALLIAALWCLVIDVRLPVDSASLYTQLNQRLGLAGMVLSVLLLSAMGVMGDLFESLVKRNAGAKDSSGLLPGHGGVLDRVDALLPVFPTALALLAL